MRVHQLDAGAIKTKAAFAKPPGEMRLEHFCQY
jgi:hypothetical protein